MTHTPHELHEEFPDKAAQIHKLKTENHHFARLSERYHELNRAIHRAESEVEPVSDEALNELRKERLKLKDDLFAMLG